MTPTDRFFFCAGRERGIATAYLARARGAHGHYRAQLVRLAREAGRESVKYVRAAKEQRA
jgi:hypothetical protein